MEGLISPNLKLMEVVSSPELVYTPAAALSDCEASHLVTFVIGRRIAF